MALSPRNRQIAAIGGLGAVVLLVGAWAWRSTSQANGSSAAGFHLKCTAPDCGSDFSIDRSELTSFPRGTQGEGFQCSKCDRFSARLANHCQRCDRWYVPSPSDPAGRCTYCNPAPQARPATTRPRTGP